MSILSSFFEGHMVSMLEAAVLAHEPELQDDFLAEMKSLSEKAIVWIEGYIAKRKSVADTIEAPHPAA